MNFALCQALLDVLLDLPRKDWNTQQRDAHARIARAAEDKEKARRAARHHGTRPSRELAAYTVRGWVRRLETSKDDGDWHIELTDRRDAPRDSCIVAEIPPPEFGDVYRQARADLAVVLRGRKRSKSGTLARPVEVQIVGAAFFDGNHRSRRRRRDTIDPPHGRCNASVSALWEIHPVYRVTGP